MVHPIHLENAPNSNAIMKKKLPLPQYFIRLLPPHRLSSNEYSAANHTDTLLILRQLWRPDRALQRRCSRCQRDIISAKPNLPNTPFCRRYSRAGFAVPVLQPPYWPPAPTITLISKLTQTTGTEDVVLPIRPAPSRYSVSDNPNQTDHSVGTISERRQRAHLYQPDPNTASNTNLTNRSAHKPDMSPPNSAPHWFLPQNPSRLPNGYEDHPLFTSDGSFPTAAATIYTGPITITSTSTTVLRTVAYCLLPIPYRVLCPPILILLMKLPLCRWFPAANRWMICWMQPVGELFPWVHSNYLIRILIWSMKRLEHSMEHGKRFMGLWSAWLRLYRSRSVWLR